MQHSRSRDSFVRRRNNDVPHLKLNTNTSCEPGTDSLRVSTTPRPAPQSTRHFGLLMANNEYFATVCRLTDFGFSYNKAKIMPAQPPMTLPRSVGPQNLPLVYSKVILTVNESVLRKYPTMMLIEFFKSFFAIILILIGTVFSETALARRSCISNRACTRQNLPIGALR
jgi:hypothetical protein